MDILAHITERISEHSYHLLIISTIFLFTWYKSVKGGFLIDDDFGIQQFSDKWRPEGKDQSGVVPELKVDYYNQETGKDDQGKPIITTFKNLQYNPTLGFPGAFMRWHRLHIGKEFKQIAKDKKEHEVYGYVQSPFKHHVWSLIVHYSILVLAYLFLSKLFGSSIALTSVCIFAVHPVSTQCVAWISGINYLYCLFFALSNFVLVQNVSNFYITIPLTVFFSFASGMTLLPGCFNCVILLLLGRPWEAFSSLLVSLLVFVRDGLGAVNFRKKNFKEQNMEKSIFFNFRKPIVILKTLWYYVCLMLVPSNLGLYHEFGYHYDEKMERMNWYAIRGLLALASLVYFALNGPFIVTFSIVWMMVYWLVFSNIITANQFVVERYIFIPSFGFSILASYLLKDYPIILWFVIGLYMSRTMGHIWTYLSHKDFYWSNYLNFRNSEVALGNLGVVNINEGKAGTAIDTWQQASQVNPFYDVAWYNLYSVFRSHGMLQEAKQFMENCLKSKTIHFKDRWEKEYKEICELVNKSSKPLIMR